MNVDASVSLDALYGRALEEYRFQVQLNWDRTKFFLLVNTTVLGAAAALAELLDTPVGGLLALLLFVVGAFVAWLGAQVTREGKRHYRAAVVKKTLLERELGLLDAPGLAADQATFATGASVSRSRAARILADVDAYVSDRVRPRSITGDVVILFWLLLALDLAGAASVAYGLAS